MKRRRIFLAVMGALAFLVAGAASLGGSAPAPLPDLSGLWAMVQVMPAMTTLPIFGAVELTTIVTALVNVEQTGTCVVLRDVYCFTDVQMNPPVAVSRVPEEFIASLHPAPRTAILEPRDSGWRFEQPWVTEVRGARLADPANEPLPTDAADPRVTDQDGDGHPGLTVPVTVAGLVSGDTYVVQRLRFALSGDVVDADTISGSIEWS